MPFATCNCVDGGVAGPIEPTFHDEVQDTQCEGWQRLLALVDQAANDGRPEFAPGLKMSRKAWSQVVTLPPTIARLKGVKQLTLPASFLVRLPPEIGEMESLEEFDLYMSYRLHWFPYEIMRCTRLRDSKVSTRALYGNYKYRPPFPRLDALNGSPISVSSCSVCRTSLAGTGAQLAWVSLNVATDVVPLLVHACSTRCLEQLPPTPENYVQGPHTGGPAVIQPPGY
jgi:hypothetical protein